MDLTDLFTDCLPVEFLTNAFIHSLNALQSFSEEALLFTDFCSVTSPSWELVDAIVADPVAQDDDKRNNTQISKAKKPLGRFGLTFLPSEGIFECSGPNLKERRLNPTSTARPYMSQDLSPELNPKPYISSWSLRPDIKLNPNPPLHK